MVEKAYQQARESGKRKKKNKSKDPSDPNLNLNLNLNSYVTRAKKYHVDGGIKTSMIDNLIFSGKISFFDPEEGTRPGRRRDIVQDLPRIINDGVGRQAREAGMESKEKKEYGEGGEEGGHETCSIHGRKTLKNSQGYIVVLAMAVG